jgi:colanic acid/amylovoran biosynthesis glycosyltransferase
MDVVFTNTEFSAAGAVERGCPREKLVILPVGFALEDFQPPAHREYRPQGTLRLVSVSRLSEGKGHVYALEALARLRAAGMDDFQYTIIGDGPLRPTLEACVEEHSLAEHVVFTGTMANTEVIPALARADALILSSHSTPTWTETQGAILHEAMLMEALVVATTTGGVPESIPAEMKPFTAEPADVPTLAEALERVYRLSESQMRSLGESVRAWTEANYDVRVLNNRILREIHERKAAAEGSAAELCLKDEVK